MILFRHWTANILNISFPSNDGLWEICDGTVAMALEADSILLPTVLASASVHMVASGVLHEAAMLARKQAAIRAMVRFLHPRYRDGPDSMAHLPLEVIDVAVSASAHLVGTEIIQGSHMSIVLPLLRGAVSLAEARWRAHRGGRVSRYDAVNAIDTHLLAWHDFMTCVPSPRRPFLRLEHWSRHFGPSRPATSPSRAPDRVFGFAEEITIVTGESATLIHERYRDLVSLPYFNSHKNALLDRLAQAKGRLPPQKHTADHVDRDKRSNYNACIFAAISHALATQIYLLRAENCAASHLWTYNLTLELEEAISRVSSSTAAVTIMLWPLWVLGCESLFHAPRRRIVVNKLQAMLEKERFMNIESCLNILQTQIWGQDPDLIHSYTLELAPTQGPRRLSEPSGRCLSWVRLCFDQAIQPVLA
jgi:hypothetical protein